MMKPALCFAGIALAITSCSSAGSPVHNGTAIVAQGTLLDNVDLDRRVNGAPGASQDFSVSAIGARAEFWQSPNTSLLFGIDKREYDVDTPGGDSGEALEIHAGGRYYFLDWEQFQPFLQATFFRGHGIDWDRGRGESDGYWGLGVGAGLAWFISPEILLEAGARYETTLIDPETNRRSGGRRNTIEDEISGVTGWLGLGWIF